MTLEERISDELKSAVKSGDKVRLETIRSLRSSIIEFNKSGVGREMNEQDEQKILLNQAKRRRDAIDMYEKAGRADLLEKEKTELKIIEEFLPQQLSIDELKLLIKKIIEEVKPDGMKDMGKIMGPIMKEIAGRADGKTVQSVVRELLG